MSHLTAAGCMITLTIMNMIIIVSSSSSSSGSSSRSSLNLSLSLSSRILSSSIVVGMVVSWADQLKGATAREELCDLFPAWDSPEGIPFQMKLYD